MAQVQNMETTRRESISQKRSRRLGERLLDAGLLSEDQLRLALEYIKQNGGFLGDVLVTQGLVSVNDIRPILEELTGFKVIDLAQAEIDPSLASALPETIATSKGVFPVAVRDGKVLLAMVDPLNLALVDEMRSRLRRPVEPCIAFTSDIADVVRRTYDVRSRTSDLLDSMVEEASTVSEPTVDDLAREADDGPVVRLVDTILQGAITAGASDIHIEPSDSNVKVRYRIDGGLRDQMLVPTNFHNAVVSRLKIVGGLDISDRRRPQDGRFSAKATDGREFDVRLSTLPTVYGEKACLRLLQKTNTIASLDRIGLLPEQRLRYERFIHRPHGLILVTGPTGSGKSTSLYAALKEIARPDININTVEDPVEFRIPGVNQVQVNVRAGVTFAVGLRALVRQDPDVILVGEIRDAETAEVAVQAALTGHLVLSTIHTNDAPSSLVRLTQMGVEPFLVASSVVGVMGQRLVRTVCMHCRETREARPEEIEVLFEGENPPDEVLVAQGRGCPRCDGMGTRGRTAVFEVAEVSDSMRDIVLRHGSSVEVYNQAVRDGMEPMRSVAVRKVLDLQVPVSEVVRVFGEQS